MTTAATQGMRVLSMDDPDAQVHVGFMKLAIEQAQLSIPVPSGYCVGAVLVEPLAAAGSSALSLHESGSSESTGSLPSPAAGYKILTTGYSRELPGNTHAEECCLIKLMEMQKQQQQQQHQPQQANNTNNSVNAQGLVIYSTMEPCSTRLSGNRPCSDRLIAAGVKTCYVGVREPDHFVQHVVGVEDMVQHGIQVIHVPGLEAECLLPNKHVLG